MHELIYALKLAFILFVPGFFLTLPFSFTHLERTFFSILFSVVLVPFIGMLLHLLLKIPLDEFLVNLTIFLSIFIGIVGFAIKQRIKKKTEKTNT